MRQRRWASVLAPLLFLACASPSPEPIPTPTAAPTPTTSSTTGSPPVPTGPSGLFDVGGHRLFVDCQGSGSTVVLDAGLGNDSRVWQQVQARVAGFARACRYDRAGLGRSEPAAGRGTSATAVTELRALLAAAGLGPPYVLVGASFGGLDVQYFAAEHPSEVMGLVLVDSLHPDLDRRIDAILSPTQSAQRWSDLGSTGEAKGRAELEASDREVIEAGPLPDVPAVVLRHGLPFESGPDWPADAVEQLWADLETDLAARLPQGRLIVAHQSHHRIHQDEPDLVTEAIRSVTVPGAPALVQPTPPAVSLGAGASPATGLRGTFAYSAEGDIWVVGADGSDLRRVTETAGIIESWPALSPDGSMVAFQRTLTIPNGPVPEPPSEIHVVDIAGDSDRLVSGDLRAQMPDWSADGSGIAFVATGSIFTVHPEGGGLTKVAIGACPKLAPDGRSLAFCSAEDEVTVATIDGTDPRLVSGSPAVDQPGAWSPDGRSLAVYSERDGNGEVYSVTVADGTTRRLTEAAGSQDPSVWTRDGIVIASWDEGAEVPVWLLLDPVSRTVRTVALLQAARDHVDWVP